jgi:Fic family protein
MPSIVQKILQKPVSHDVVRSLAAIYRGRGKQELYKERAPEMLENLRRVAVIESTESSNRIEGVIVPRAVLQRIVEKKAKPAAGSRSEAEVAGYREVLGLIHERFEHIPLTSGVVRQLHRDLYKYAGGHGGKWKVTENEITEERPDGRKIVRFSPVRAFRTAGAMDELHERFGGALDEGNVDPLILDALYVLDFLCIHPFTDGNGRMSRLLTVMLLNQQGFEVGRYVSIERLIEQTKESYYDTLHRSSQGWHEDKHDPMPWVAYALSVVRAAYDELGSRIDNLKGQRGVKTAFVLQAIDQAVGDFSVSELHQKVPSVGLDMVRKVLKEEKASGRIISLGRGRAARWRRATQKARVK